MHACAHADDGQAWAAGEGEGGVLGLGTMVARARTPQRMQLPGWVMSAAAGMRHTLLLVVTDGSRPCSPQAGQAAGDRRGGSGGGGSGDGSMAYGGRGSGAGDQLTTALACAVPTVPRPELPPRATTTGTREVCVFGCGSNRRGQLGLPVTAPAPAPAGVEAGADGDVAKLSSTAGRGARVQDECAPSRPRRGRQRAPRALDMILWTPQPLLLPGLGLEARSVGAQGLQGVQGAQGVQGVQDTQVCVAQPGP